MVNKPVLELKYCNLDVILILCDLISFMSICEIGFDDGDQIWCVISNWINDIVFKDEWPFLSRKFLHDMFKIDLKG